MYQSYVGSIDTDSGIGTILSRFESQYILDVVGDSLKMRFRPFNTPMPNMVDTLERQFQVTYISAPDYKDKIDDCRTETYKEIISIICNFYQLQYSYEINTLPIDELYSISSILYDVFISRFTDHMIDFFTRYIVKNVDQITEYLENDPTTIKIKDNTMYQSKQYIDSKWILIHQNVNKIVYNMAAYDITFEDILRYILDPNISDRLLSLFTDTNSIYKNHYANYILDQTTASGIYTNIKLRLQAETQRRVNIGEF